jgi:hypothetical protein
MNFHASAASKLDEKGQDGAVEALNVCSGTYTSRQ